MKPDPLISTLLHTLRQRGGVVTGAELQAALGVSQPTVSRALAPLLQSGEVVKVGAARLQRYVLPRTVTGLGRVIPIVRIDAHGQASPFARLTPLQGSERTCICAYDGPQYGLRWRP